MLSDLKLVYISHCSFICTTDNKEKDNSKKKKSLYSLLCILLKNQLGLCLSWKSVHGSIQSSSSHFIFFFYENGHTFGSLSINLHAFQPWSYSCLHSIPALPSIQTHSAHCTHSSKQQPSRCHAVYAFTLSSLCWLLACCLFLFLLSVFFMHSTTLRRSSASPANFSMFPLHTLALLSLLHHYSSCSSSLLIHLPLWTGSGCFKLPSSDDSVAKDLLEECPPCPRSCRLVIWSSIQS